jgi:hypothetical protein
LSLKNLVSRYISSAELALKHIEVEERQVVLNPDSVSRVTDQAKAYLEDAKYYREKQKFEVSLTSIAYCEGLLDALRELGLVKFEWHLKEKKDEE